ncbi:MAG TPA: IS110 family transposase [Anaerolineales bacterium]|jgi:transposase|nr:IS110 family transposase [Anaerolineales bacterium]
MKKGQDTRGYERYLALDIHREYILVGGWNEKKEWVLTPRRVSIEKFPEWAKKNIRHRDIVVLETTTNVWTIYDIVVPLASWVMVANAVEVWELAGARVKTDKEDIKRLLKLLVGGIVPEVWVPPLHVRELRAFISYRARLVTTATMIRNRLQSLLHKHNLLLSENGLLDAAWWQRQAISRLERIQIEQELSLLQEVEKRKASVDQELELQSTGSTWGKPALQLMQLPGVGYIVAMTVLAAIGDISRFENAKQLVGYAGIGAGVHDSGKTHKEKKITKKGRRELRWALVEAAWRAVRMSPFWKAEYEKHLQRMRKPNQAIVVIARKLLIAIWHVLSKDETDIHASEEDLAYKMLLLSWSLKEDTRRGLTYKEFAKYALMKLGVETDITRFVRKKVPRRLASRDEVLMRMTELGLSA